MLSLLLLHGSACDINIGGEGDDGGGSSGSQSEDSDETTAGDPSGGPSSSAETGDSSSTTMPTDQTSGVGSESTGGTGFSATCDDEASCGECYQCTVQPGGDCSDTADACLDDPDCSAIVDCQSSCAAQAQSQEEADACAGSCAASYPAGAVPFAALVECREWTCLNTCGGWGSLCDMEESCESCSTCASEDAGPCGSYLDACNNSPSCVAFASCGQECAAVSQTQNEYDNCLLDCQTLEPEGASTFFELDACSISQCPVTCAG